MLDNLMTKDNSLVVKTVTTELSMKLVNKNVMNVLTHVVNVLLKKSVPNVTIHLI